MSRLSATYREVLARELENLPKLIPEWVDEFRVQVFDLDTLSIHCNRRFYEYAYLLDEKGNVLVTVGSRVEKKVEKQKLHQRLLRMATVTHDVLVDFSETVEQALERCEGRDEVRYILSFERRTLTAKLYKIPKGVVFTDHVTKKQEEAHIVLTRSLE